MIIYLRLLRCRRLKNCTWLFFQLSILHRREWFLYIFWFAKVRMTSHVIPWSSLVVAVYSRGAAIPFWLYVVVVVVVCWQVGHEPLPPTLGRNLFGRQVYQLPGLFAYGESPGQSPFTYGICVRVCSNMRTPCNIVNTFTKQGAYLMPL